MSQVLAHDLRTSLDNHHARRYGQTKTTSRGLQTLDRILQAENTNLAISTTEGLQTLKKR